MTLTWTAPSGTLTGYDVHYTSALDTAVLDGAPATGTDASAAWVAVSRSGTGGLADDHGPGRRHQLPGAGARAENASAKGHWAHATRQAAPTGLTVTPDETNPWLWVSWTAPSGNIGGYDVHFTSSTSVDDGRGGVRHRPCRGLDRRARTLPGPSGTTYIIGTHDVGLTPGVTYRVRLRTNTPDSAWVFSSGTPRGTTPPAPTGTTVWSATLTAQDTLAGIILGCDNFAPGKKCSSTSVLTEDQFTHNGVTYDIVTLALDSGTLKITLNKDTASSFAFFTLEVDGSSIGRPSVSTRSMTWTNTGLSWSEDDTVSLRLVGEPVPTVRLSASPNPVAEGLSVTVTATLSAALSSDVTIPVTITDGTAEPEDHGTLTGITIALGSTRGTGTITTAQDPDTDDETFTVALGTLPSNVTAGSPGSVEIRIRDDDRTGRVGVITPADLTPSFGAASIPDELWVVGTQITALTLPAATGGDGVLTYRLSPALPSGLVLDTATRTLTGTPTTAQASRRYTWTATDADGDTATLNFTITVEASRRSRIQEAVKRTLAEVARRAMASTLDNIGARFGDIGTSGMSLAGQWVSLQDLRAKAALTGNGLLYTCTAQLGFEPSDCMQPARSMTAGSLFGDSSFSLHLNAAPNGMASKTGPLWSVWGRGDIGSFAGRGDTNQRYDGDLRTGWLGIDARAGAWVAGLAISHADGEADYGFSEGSVSVEGELDTKMTAIYPYGRWTLGNDLELHGVVGAGTGDARHKPQDGETESGDLTMRMVSLGLRQTLPEMAGLHLAVRADASATRIETDDGPDDIHGLSADSWRLRAGLEASRPFALGQSIEFRPFMEAAVRQDGGDGLEGSGVEVAGGLRYAARHVFIEARGRWLATHSDEGAQEKGVSVTARAGPGANGRGLFLALNPRWGAATGGAQALWGETMANPSESTNEGTVDAQLGYAFAAPVPGVITPFIETALAGDDQRHLRLGTRFEAANVRLELVGERSERNENAVAELEHLLKLDLQLGLF